MRDTRETVEQDYRYMIFDVYADMANRGEITLEQAMVEYVIEITAIEDQLIVY